MENIIATNSFVPHPLFRGGHPQTLAAHFFSGSPLVPRCRDIIVKTRDNDKILCRVSEPDPLIHGTVTRAVFLFHGLAGSSEATYMLHAAKRFNDDGWCVVRVNQRSAGDSLHISQKFYHSGRLHDYEDVFVQFKNLYPNWQHCVFIGYSMSGNMLLSYGANPGLKQPNALITVCAPLRLKDASINMNNGLNRVYQADFLMGLLKMIKIKKGADFLRSTKLGPFSTMYDFDHSFVAQEAGLSSAEEYYRMTSSFEHVPRVQIPHHMIVAEDDPIVNVGAYLQFKPNALGKLYRFSEGGHLGFMSEGKNFAPKRSLEDYLVRISEKTLQNTLKVAAAPKSKLPGGL